MQRKLLTPLEIYKELAQTNCKQCFLPGCLAFSAAVVAGDKKLADCPFLAAEKIEELARSLKKRSDRESVQAAFLEELERKISTVDFEKIAPIIGATVQKNILSITSLGKKFHVDKQGQLTSECHIISWVQAPVLSYITNKTHQNITGDWITFREIEGGIDWQGLFTSRCEKPLQKLADLHPDLFEDLIDLFQGKQAEGFQADIAIVLYPLPHIPIMLNYQVSDEEMESELTFFFDACCQKNLHVQSLFTLCSGLVQMFEQIVKHHV